MAETNALRLALLFVLAAIFTTLLPAESKSNDSKTGFAVVELFTSEGCNGCPATEARLAEICLKMHESGKRVFYLQFHIDYWDNIGWKDPYASKEATARQKEFIKLSGAKTIKTPQVAVNGRETSGSDLWSVINKGLTADASVRIDFSANNTDKDKLTVKYELEGIVEASKFLVCLVERELVSKCKAGENKGRTLRHENSVRSFQTLDVAKDCKGDVVLALPGDVDIKNTSLVAYVFTAKDGVFTGAEYKDMYSRIPPGSPPSIAVIEYYGPPGGAMNHFSWEEKLSSLCKRHAKEKIPSYLVAYHVDDVLFQGSRDSVGLKICTERFKAYTKAMGIKKPVTPILAVNGELCPDIDNIEKMVSNALNTHTQTEISIDILNISDKKVKVEYEVNCVNDKLTLTLCVIQRKVIGEYKEPESTTFVHNNNVVRNFTTITIRKNSKHTVELSLPEGLDSRDSFILAYTSDEDWRVTGGMILPFEE